MSLQYGLLSQHQYPAFQPLLPPDHPPLGTPGLYALGAVLDDLAVGLLVFQADDLTMVIQHLAVAEDFRRRGIANGLINCLCETAWENTIEILGSFTAADWDTPLCHLLTKRGDFTLEETEDYICRVPQDALERATLSAPPPAGSRIVPFYTLPEQTRRSFLSHMRERDGAYAAAVRRQRAQMLEPLCLCAVDRLDEVTAAIFCQRDEDGVALSLVYALPGHARGLMSLVSRLRELLIQAADRVPYLTIAAVTPESRKLVEALLPEREITSRFYAFYWDMNTMGGTDHGE